MSTSWCQWLTVQSNKSEDQDVQGVAPTYLLGRVCKPLPFGFQVVVGAFLACLADRRKPSGNFPRGSCELAYFSYLTKIRAHDYCCPCRPPADARVAAR